jgi:hypothetical protein
MTEEPMPYEAAAQEKVLVLEDIGLRVRHRVVNGVQLTTVEDEDCEELFSIRGRHLTRVEARACYSAYGNGFARGKAQGLDEATEKFLAPIRLIGRALGDGLGESKVSDALWNALDNLRAVR